MGRSDPAFFLIYRKARRTALSEERRNMTNEEKDYIIRYRKAGKTYAEIATALGMSLNTVKSFCRRNYIIFDLPASVSEEIGRFCLQCGIPINKQPHGKTKRFCSDACRLCWWHSHRNLAKNATEYKCQNCGKVFRSVRLQKYCSRTCYFEARYGRKSYERDLDTGAV